MIYKTIYVCLLLSLIIVSGCGDSNNSEQLDGDDDTPVIDGDIDHEIEDAEKEIEIEEEVEVEEDVVKRLLGESCYTNENCEEGLFCLYGSYRNECTKICENDADCGEYNCSVWWMDSKVASLKNVCKMENSVSLGQAGQTCTSYSDCASSLCLTTDDGKKVCGELCKDANDCIDGWECIERDSKLEGLYLPSIFSFCVPENYNYNQKAGEYCDQLWQCDSGFCFDNVCSPICSKPSDCGEGIACVQELVGDREFPTALLGICDNPKSGPNPTEHTCTLHQDCESRVCMAGKCTHLCEQATDCPSDWSCTPFDFNRQEFSLCTPKDFEYTPIGKVIGNDFSCKNQLPITESSTEIYCSKNCSNNADCTDLGENWSCGTVELTPPLLVKMCIENIGQNEGEPCSNNEECKSIYCVANVCAGGVCDEDEHCLETMACKQITINNEYESHPFVNQVKRCLPENMDTEIDLAEPCAFSELCTSGICQKFEAGLSQICTMKCSSHADCYNKNGICGYNGKCLRLILDGKAPGEPCEKFAECKYGLCLPPQSGGMCSMACINDTECDVLGADFKCIAETDNLPLYCMKTN